MALDGEIAPLDAAIFADTGSEPPDVYRHLDWLTSRFDAAGVPLYRVSQGDLGATVLEMFRLGREGWKTRRPTPPLYVRNDAGEEGIIRRQCTATYKVEPITRKLRELAGVPNRGRRPTDHRVTQLFGISLDEIQRMRTSDQPWIRNEYPLIDRRMTRWDCLRWNEDRGYPRPPRSACIFCPYHSDAEWRRLRDDDPFSWHQAVAFDAAIRDGSRIALRGETFLHSSLVPLAEVDLSTAEDHGQLNLFDQECEGMCGL
jgi:hypothetical protein